MIFNCCCFELMVGVKTYGCFEPGTNNVYYRFVYSAPLGPEDEGYESVRCWAKGLPILTLDLRKKYVLQNPYIVHRTPMYVVNLWQFENRAIQFMLLVIFYYILSSRQWKYSSDSHHTAS